MSNHSKPLTGLLSWEPVDELIERTRSIGPWYIHSPEKGMETLFVAEAGEASAFLAARIEDVKNRKQGAGWVYVHTPDTPSWIKIYDPYKCASCGTRSPKAWWEMALEDPRDGLPEKPPVREKKNLLDWFKEIGSPHEE
ncbi:MAG: hypothetical protein COW52_00990 [Nitrospirae bacterium CG17_big_fil_post_rev_8_21_14_2_50_50_9]|nr:MAG: hypothetical protein COW52_00990 [Nitrospirae bacterium CG17_big_fil_post_rev_8_21_14_2_50_50_9]